MSQVESHKISKVTCQFEDGALEKLFQSAKVSDWSKRLKIGGWILLFLHLFANISDVIQFGQTADSILIFAVRLVLVFVGIGLIVKAEAIVRRRSTDWVLFLMACVLLGAQSYIVYLKQMHFAFHAFSFQFSILIFYFFVPARFLLKLSLGLVFSIAYIALVNFVYGPSVQVSLFLALVLLLASNLIGATKAYREQHLERSEFLKTYKAEEELKARKEIEQALQESKERYDLAMNAAADHVYTWEVEEDKLQVSLYKSEAFGIKYEPVTSGEWLSRLHPEDREIFRKTMIEYVKGKSEAFNLEYRLADDKGDYHHVRQQALGKRGPDGRVTWMAGAAIDITEQKEARRQLRKSEEMYRAIFRNAGAGIALTDLEGHFFQCNETWSEILGNTENNRCEEETGHTIYSLSHPDHRENLTNQITSLIDGSVDNCRFENLFIREDGTHWWGDVSLSPIHEIDGSVQSVVVIVHDITDRKEHEEELRVYATTDGLTGAMNRRYFMENCESELHRAKRYNRDLSFLLLDLDHFKNVNDTYGHAGGDEALKMVSKYCKEALRDEDIFGRIGGEEFAIILPEINKTAAIEVAERLRQGISDLIIHSEKQEFQLTASVGVSSLQADDKSPDTALKRADKALYAAKDDGRNRVEAA